MFYKGYIGVLGMYRDITPMMENQRENKMDNEMKTVVIDFGVIFFIGVPCN